MTKAKIPLKSEFVTELADLLWPQYVLPIPPDGTPDVIAVEHAGDTALHQQRYSDALDRYKSLSTSVRRVRYKMAWCHYQLGQPDSTISFLRDAEKVDGTLHIALLCYALEDKGRSSENFMSTEGRQRVIELVRIALSRPAPVVGIYYLAAQYIYGSDERDAHIQAAYQRYPSVAQFRQNYLYLAMRKQLLSEKALLEIAISAIKSDLPTVDDIWVALRIACHYHRSGEAAVALQVLKERAGDEPMLLLVEADIALQFNRPVEASLIFAEARWLVEASDTKNQMRCIAWILRGLIHSAILSRNRHEVIQHAVQLARHYIDGELPDQWLALYEGGSGFMQDHYIQIPIGEEIAHAEPLTNLFEFREHLLADDLPKEIRGVYRAVFVANDWSSADGPENGPGDHERQQAAALTELDNIVAETRSPSVGNIVGCLQLLKKLYDAAGYTFASYSLARLDMFGEGELYVDDPLGDDDSRDEIQAFAQGMVRCYEDTLEQEPKHLTRYGARVVSALVRSRLLDNKCFGEFDALIQSIEKAAQVDGADSLDEQTWFDIGLAHHYMHRTDAAISAYRHCLLKDPDHSSAQKNLEMLLSPEARKREIALRYIRNQVKLLPPGTIEQLTLEEAIYLLTLFRAGGGLEQDRTLRPFKDSEFPFAPTRDLRQPLFHLLHCGLVHISPESPIHAFEIDLAKGEVSGVYTQMLAWELPVATVALIRAVESVAITGKWPQAWHDQAPALAMGLARGECIEYLAYSADERGFPEPQGEKPGMMFDNLLTTYSVAQCYAFIYRGARNAADYRQRKSITSAHASNLMVSSVQRYADTARTEGWDVKPYSRIKTCPRSMLSYVLHDTFLRTGERSFNTPIPQLFIAAA